MNLEKLLKPTKGFIIAIIVSILVTVACFAGSIYLQEEPKKIDSYHDLIAKGEDKEGNYVSLNFVSLPWGFAEETDNSITRNYYFVFDKNNYMYIVRLTDDTIKKIEDRYEKNKDDFSYELKGYIFTDQEELKKLAVSGYNEAVGENDKITLDSLVEYVGDTYLDETNTPNDDWIGLLMVFAIMGFVLTLIFIVCYIITAIRAKKIAKKWNLTEIESEYMSSDREKYKKEGVCFTKKYVIARSALEKIIPYENLVWAYKEIRKQNGIKVGEYLIAYTKDKKRHILAQGKAEAIANMIVELAEKNKKIMIGYTKENQQAFKELPKIKENS